MFCAVDAFPPLASTLHSVQFAHTRSEFMWLSHLHICWVFFFFSVLISALFAFIEGKWNLAEKLQESSGVRLFPPSLNTTSKWTSQSSVVGHIFLCLPSHLIC